MVNEIFTRIQLKYDSYANWTSNNPLLLSGEIAIAKLVDDLAAPLDTNKNAPVLFKVGPGNFNDLPWASALAADVYSWAKLAGDKVFAKDGAGNVISGIEYDATLNEGKGGFKYTTASVATSEGLKDVQDRLADLEEQQDEFLLDTDTRYTFELKDKQLIVKSALYTNGVKGEEAEVGSYDIIDDIIIDDPEFDPDKIIQKPVSGLTWNEEANKLTVSRDYINIEDVVTIVTSESGVYYKDLPTTLDELQNELQGNIDSVDARIGAWDTVDQGGDTIVGYIDFMTQGIATNAEAIAALQTAQAGGLVRSIVTSLPEVVDAKDNVIYMIKRDVGFNNKDVYDEYILVQIGDNKQFELLGNTEMDLSNYYTKEEIEGKNYKVKQSPVSSPAADGAASGSIAFIDWISQDANGVIDAHKSYVDFSNCKTKQAEKNFDGSTVKTVTNVKQNANGEVEVSFGDIAFPAPPKGTGDVAIATIENDIVTLNGGVKLNDHKLEDDTTKNDITLAKIAKTGSIYDVAEGVNGTTTKYLVFNCGSATTVI